MERSLQGSITINEARKMLGSKFSDMSDNQIQEIVQELTLIANLQARDLGSQKCVGSDII